MNVNNTIREKYILDFKKINSKKAEIIEKSIYNFSMDYFSTENLPDYMLDQIYETKASEILSLLNNKKIDILNKLTDNEISNIAFMKSNELNPDKYDKILKKQKIEEDKQKNQATSTAYQCKKCKNKKCQVTQRQVRAADEPATTFIKCIECGYEFSFN